MDNANRFIDAFTRIEKECRNIICETRYMKFYQVLQLAAKRNSTVRKYEIELQEYADLRNAIVHQRSDEGEIIAQPIDSVVSKIERIADLLAQPEKLKDHFLKSVKVCHPQEDVKQVFMKMNELGTSKLPIYQNHEFVGLLTLEMIANWAVLHQTEMPNPCVHDIFKPQYKKEKVLFLSKEASVIEALEVFEEGMAKGITILAVLITKSGNKADQAEGILTIADLPRLTELAD